MEQTGSHVTVGPICIGNGEYRMNNSTPASKVFNAEPPIGSRPPFLCKDQLEKDLAAFVISNWRQTGKRKNACCAVVNSNIIA